MTDSLSWIYDDSPIDDPFDYGERAVQFLRALKHPKSTAPDRAFQLDPWQERIVRRIYGPCHPNGRRIVRTVAMMLPRGNRKTSLGAALGLLHTIGKENTAGAQNMVAATDRKQARIAYEEAFSIIEATVAEGDRKLKIELTDSDNYIGVKRTKATFKAMSSDGKVAHGYTPSFALLDEIHAWPKRDLWEAIKSGLVKVPNSLLMVISTAGRGQQNLAWEFFDYARKVQRGEVDNPSWLPILFETPRDADWTDEEVWHRANPGLRHGYPDLEGMREYAREAREQPAERATFQQLNLNMWLDGSTNPFVDMMIYDEGKAPFDLEEMEGLPCWLGVDLARTSDLSVIVAAWRDGETLYVWAWYFCPEQDLRKREDTDKVPYVQWADEGFIRPTGGTVTDYRVIEAEIREICARFDVREIAFDPKYGAEVMRNLSEDDLPVVEFGQGWATMGPAAKDLERAIIGRRFRHGGHPILRWNFENIVTTTDRNGNITFNKGKSREKIDGAVASAMAVARAIADESTASFYDKVGDDEFDKLLEDMYA